MPLLGCLLLALPLAQAEPPPPVPAPPGRESVEPSRGRRGGDPRALRRGRPGAERAPAPRREEARPLPPRIRLFLLRHPRLRAELLEGMRERGPRRDARGLHEPRRGLRDAMRERLRARAADPFRTSPRLPR